MNCLGMDWTAPQLLTSEQEDLDGRALKVDK